MDHIQYVLGQIRDDGYRLNNAGGVPQIIHQQQIEVTNRRKGKGREGIVRKMAWRVECDSTPEMCRPWDEKAYYASYLGFLQCYRCRIVRN